MATGPVPQQESHKAEAASEDERNPRLHPTMSVPGESRVYPPGCRDKIPQGFSAHRGKNNSRRGLASTTDFYLWPGMHL